MKKLLRIVRKALSLALCFTFLFSQSGFAQVAAQLDLSGYLGRSLRPADKLRPVCLRYFSYEPLNNEFKLLLDKGDFKKLGLPQAKESAKDLLKYFLIGVTLPDASFWVNLRPDSPDRIIDDTLAKTDIGRIFLESDVQLKKDLAQFTSPQTAEGKIYWNKLYKKAGELFGSEDVTIPTLIRPWIVPGEIIVRQSGGSAYVYKATLKVMLEEDYLEKSETLNPKSETNPKFQIQNSKLYQFNDPRQKALNEYSAQLIRELILPKLTKEVNSSKRYASLRQVYYSLILARWFKANFQGKEGAYSSLIDQRNLNGLASTQAWSKTVYFNEYKKSFEKGEYNIKEPVSGIGGQAIRSYVSGGVGLAQIPIAGLEARHSNWAVESALGFSEDIICLGSGAGTAASPVPGELKEAKLGGSANSPVRTIIPPGHRIVSRGEERFIIANLGSTSVKMELQDAKGNVIAKGATKGNIGDESCSFSLDVGGQKSAVEHIKTHEDALSAFVEAVKTITDEGKNIQAVFYKTVQGGPKRKGVFVLDEPTLRAMEDTFLPLAPEHNKFYALAARALEGLLPGAIHLGRFEPMTHISNTAESQTTSLPRNIAGALGLDAAGFHGASFAYLIKRIPLMLNEHNISAGSRYFMLHVGGSSSAGMAENGQSLETSMMGTPESGFTQGTRATGSNVNSQMVEYVVGAISKLFSRYYRDEIAALNITNRKRISKAFKDKMSGLIDEAVTGLIKTGALKGKPIDYEAEGAIKMPYSVSMKLFITDLVRQRVNRMLTEESGLKGIAGIGTGDVEKIKEQARKGNIFAKLAYDVLIYEARGYLGNYIFKLGGEVDVIAFTAGTGENDPEFRERVIGEGRFFGRQVIKLDPELNKEMVGGKEGIISALDSQVKVLVIKANEAASLVEDCLAKYREIISGIRAPSADPAMPVSASSPVEIKTLYTIRSFQEGIPGSGVSNRYMREVPIPEEALQGKAAIRIYEIMAGGRRPCVWINFEDGKIKVKGDGKLTRASLGAKDWQYDSVNWNPYFEINYDEKNRANMVFTYPDINRWEPGRFKKTFEVRLEPLEGASSPVTPSPLLTFQKIEQQIWLDGLTYEMLLNGEFEALVRDHGISGVTTNPPLIKAYLADERVKAKLAKFAREGLSQEQIYSELIEGLARAVISTYEKCGVNGKFSVEIDPTKAEDVNASVTEAIKWTDINPDYMMVKVPVSEAGYQIIEEVIARGRNVNVTLIFSPEQYWRAGKAYIKGLRRALLARHNLSRIYSVASFFISRWDIKFAQQIPLEYHGMFANSIAIDAYNRIFRALFESDEFKALEVQGARVQDFLLASTRSKASDPNIPDIARRRYPEDVYVSNVQGPHVVNTLPIHTINFLKTKEDIKPDKTIISNNPLAQEILKVMDVDLEAAGLELSQKGLDDFKKEFNEIQATISGIVSSAAVSSSPLSTEDDSPLPGAGALGGIDFAAMNINIQRIGSFSGVTFSPPARAVVEKLNLSEESKQLKLMLDRGVLPSDPRLKEFIYGCHFKNELNQRIGDVVPLLAQYCRLEEEDGRESGAALKESLMLVDVE